MFRDYGKKCESVNCKELAVDIHHKDGNHKNNKKSNLAYLCRSCHTKQHYDTTDEEHAFHRHLDLVDDLQDHRTGYRLAYGYALLNDDYNDNSWTNT
jgi:5-methylcytosine-specific restriction endonuclease McrA